MTQLPPLDGRRIIPRWRPFARTLEAGELRSLASGSPREVDAVDLHPLDLEDFAARPSLPFAADLLTRGLATHEGRDFVMPVAKWVVQNRPRTDAITVVARHILEPEVSHLPAPPNGTHSEPRERLREEPRNAIAWVDLALRQVSSGHASSAQRSMRSALHFAPDNRHVLRSAAALYSHLGTPDEALYVLRRSSRTQVDPWLQAAELALAQEADEPSRTEKAARNQLRGQRVHPRDASELSAALASLEADAGRDKVARRYLELAVADPTDNSVAQAEVESTRVRFEVPAEVLGRRGQDEAQARDHYGRLEWHQALEASRRWQEDQSFSLDAAILRTFVAATGLEDYEDAVHAARLGLRASPRDATLVNNLAFSLASLGRAEEAAAVLETADVANATEMEEVFLTATRGLVRFRLGDHVGGREFYRQAIDSASRHGWRNYIAWAYLYLAREEAAAHTAVASQALANAQLAADREGSAMTRALAQRVTDFATVRGYSA